MQPRVAWWLELLQVQCDDNGRRLHALGLGGAAPHTNCCYRCTKGCCRRAWSCGLGSHSQCCTRDRWVVLVCTGRLIMCGVWRLRVHAVCLCLYSPEQCHSMEQPHSEHAAKARVANHWVCYTSTTTTTTTGLTVLCFAFALLGASYELVEPDGRPDPHRPIYRCPGCWAYANSKTYTTHRRHHEKCPLSDALRMYGRLWCRMHWVQSPAWLGDNQHHSLPRPATQLMPSPTCTRLFVTSTASPCTRQHCNATAAPVLAMLLLPPPQLVAAMPLPR